MSNILQTSRFHSIGNYLKDRFGCKVIKLSLDGGFTCPNRDGTKGTGGCIFCSDKGAGDFASQIPQQISLLSSKWPSAKYIAYFQSHTNTYAPVSLLKQKYEEALAYPGVVGLAIATRPDCLSPEVLELLTEMNEKTFLWVELGLQTIHENTASLINRCYSLPIYDRAMEELYQRRIKAVVHLIFGLPGEKKEQMLQSVQYVCDSDPFGIKLHMLNVVKGSQMEHLYADYVPFKSIEEYVSLVCDAIERIPDHVTLHRLTADAPRPTLIAPPWSYKKRTILNGIQQELKRRNAYQGQHARNEPKEKSFYVRSGPSLPSL